MSARDFLEKDYYKALGVPKDAKRRKEYDEARTLFGAGGFGRRGAPGGAGAPGGGGFAFDLGDLFGQPGGQGAGGLGDVLGGLFGGRAGGRTTSPRRGADMESEVTLAFHDAVEGVTVPLRM